MIHTDRKIVKSLLRGEEKAFTEFFNDYFPRLFQFALTRLWHNEDLAEEAVQNALSKAMGKLDTFRGEAALFTWLCTFCRHEIGAIVKRENKLGEKVEFIDDSDAVISALDSMTHAISEDPFTHCEKQELAELVHCAKSHIPGHYSDILEWKYLYSYSIKEIAEKTGRSPKACESLLTRAKMAFKEAFSILADAKDPHTSISGSQHNV